MKGGVGGAKKRKSINRWKEKRKMSQDEVLFPQSLMTNGSQNRADAITREFYRGIVFFDMGTEDRKHT